MRDVRPQFATSHGARRAPTLTRAPSRLMSRKCACGGGGAAGVKGSCEECEGKKLTLRRSASAHGSQGSAQGAQATAPPIVNEVLGSSGRALEAPVRREMESHFGHDFSRVRVHTDARASESARSVGALAYTVGSDIVFGAGQYAPATEGGRRLLAHELAHTVQQAGPVRLSSEELSIGDAADASEREADEAAEAVMRRRPFGVNATAAPRVARQPAPGAAAPAPCYDSPYCKEHIPGSAWDFGIKSDEEIERNKGALKKDPALRKKLGVMRVAVEVKKFLLANAPELLNGLADVLVNPAIMTAVGAQMGKCALPRPATPQGRPAQCVEVPLKMEDEAALFNKGEEPRPGEMDRDAWSARIRRIFTHEVAHLTFDINKPPGISATDEVSLWELSELSAILSEFRIWVGEEVRRARGAKTKEVAAEEWGDKYIEKKGEGVRGILMKIRCTVPCEVANASIKATFETRTAGWPQEDADLLLRVLTNPSRFLDWPMPPPPRTIKPPTPDVERPLPDRPKQGPLYAPRGGFDFNEP